MFKSTYFDPFPRWLWFANKNWQAMSCTMYHVQYSGLPKSKRFEISDMSCLCVLLFKSLVFFSLFWMKTQKCHWPKFQCILNKKIASWLDVTSHSSTQTSLTLPWQKAKVSCQCMFPAGTFCYFGYVNCRKGGGAFRGSVHIVEFRTYKDQLNLLFLLSYF